jgi:hypothetical protein
MSPAKRGSAAPPVAAVAAAASAYSSSSSSSKRHRYHEGLAVGPNVYADVLPKTVIKHMKIITPVDPVTGPGGIRFVGAAAWNEIIR